MRELLSRAEQLNEVAKPNYDYVLALAQPLGIHSIHDDKVAHLSSDSSFCRPVRPLLKRRKHFPTATYLARDRCPVSEGAGS